MNSIKKYLHKEDRPLTWLSKQSGIDYQRLYRNIDLTDAELYKTLTYSEVNQLNEVIPNFKTQITQ